MLCHVCNLLHDYSQKILTKTQTFWQILQVTNFIVTLSDRDLMFWADDGAQCALHIHLKENLGGRRG